MCNCTVTSEKSIIRDLVETLQHIAETRDRAYNSIGFALDYCEQHTLSTDDDAASAVDTYLTHREQNAISNASIELGISTSAVEELIS